MPDSTEHNEAQESVASILAGLKPDELFARGMQSVKITGAGGLADWKPPTIEEAMRLFPAYEVMEIIGRGGMGVVYKARQLALDRTVAVKLLPLEVSMDRDFAERFKREARMMAKLNHPNIVSVFDFGTTPEGHLFFVMEFVEGTTLHHLIKTTGLKPMQAYEIIGGVCEALSYAHTEGVVHRDVKPANVLVDVKGRVKVTDFGLARLNAPSAAEQAGYTMTGTVLGTPDYMAPEQKRGMHVDHRADIYSLGVMFYEMLCGQVPQGVFDLPSQRISVDERVDQVVIRAMQQEPERRYQNTVEMKHEVQTLRLPRDPNARAPQPRSTGAKAAQNRTPAVLGIAAAAAMAVAAIVIFKKPPPGSPDSSTSIPPSQPPPAQAAEPENAVAPNAPPKSSETASTAPTQPPPAVSATNTLAPEPATTAPQPPVVPVTPPGPNAPATSLNSTTVTTAPRIEDRGARNPDMAQAVAQLGPATQPADPGSSAPTPVLQEWERLADRGELLVKRRDPEGAIEAFDAALKAAELSTTPVPRRVIADLCYKVGSLEARIDEIASARGSLERGKEILLGERKAGKLDAAGLELLGNIEATLRSLPRQ